MRPIRPSVGRALRRYAFSMLSFSCHPFLRLDSPWITESLVTGYGHQPSDRSRLAWPQLLDVDGCVGDSDSRDVIAERLRAERVPDLELRLAQWRRDTVLHAAHRRAKADELTTLPDPIAAREGEAEARRMSERAIRRIDHIDEDRARSIRAGLERPKPMLRDLARQQDEPGAGARERGSRLACGLRRRRADDGQRAELRGEGKEHQRIEPATVEHHRMRKLMGCPREQGEGERELAARPASGEKGQPAARHAADPREAIEL